MVDEDATAKTVNRGRLKYGNQSGDPSKSPRCGAHCKSTGQPCRAPGMRRSNGVYSRCYMHGGRSTGPKTPEGKERVRQARITHGRSTAKAKAIRRELRDALRAIKAKLTEAGAHDPKL